MNFDLSEEQEIIVDSVARFVAKDSPVESFRAWEREAEDNVLSRLNRAGFLALGGEMTLRTFHGQPHEHRRRRIHTINDLVDTIRLWMDTCFDIAGRHAVKPGRDFLIRGRILAQIAR